MYKEIVEKIIELLKADSELAEPSKIRRYFFGYPPKPTVYPFISVRWAGGPVSQESAGKERYEMRFEILIVDQSPSEDQAERSVMDKAERVDDVLEADVTLGGLVDYSRVTDYASESVVAGSYSIVGARVTLTAYKIKL